MMLTTLLSLLPLLLMFILVTHRKGLPVHYTLPLTALMMYVIQASYFAHNNTQLNAVVISGLLTTATPMLILWGAILLFETMNTVGSVDAIKQCLQKLCQTDISKLMLIGWAFSFFIEGVSGFGTPAVLAAPLLLASGFAAFRVVCFCLVMNTIPVSFGAVGTPIWFGFSELTLSPEQLQSIALKTALVQGLVALVIPVLALRLLLSWKQIQKHIVFIYVSILSTIIPYILISMISTEFPSIIGGLCGLVFTGFYAYKTQGTESSAQAIDRQTLFKACFPLGSCLVLLIATRLPFGGVRTWLNTGQAFFEQSLGFLGHLSISSSAVIRLEQILQTETSWKHALLYVPSILPFALVSLICFALFKTPRANIRETFQKAQQKLTYPFLAMLGAMVFVKLFMFGGDNAPSMHIGVSLSQIAGSLWSFAGVFLGALGSFFAGSCTVSNLTFAPIQASTAEIIGMNLSTALSLQAVGGAMGNMTCLHNIVAVCAMLGLQNQEGSILKKTLTFALIYGLIAGAIASFLS